VSAMSDNLEEQVETLCHTILKTDVEYWDIRNRAVLQITELFRSYQKESPIVINEAFTTNLFRSLLQPIKSLVT
jgi:hypothetical protein